MKRYFTVSLKSDQVGSFLAIALECRATAIKLPKGLLYIVDGAMRDQFKDAIHALVGFANYREFPNPPGGATTMHAKEVRHFFPAAK